MVRAATWLHFGSGGAARARVSATVTSMPRHARSIASVKPDRSGAHDQYIRFIHLSHQ